MLQRILEVVLEDLVNPLYFQPEKLLAVVVALLWAVVVALLWAVVVPLLLEIVVPLLEAVVVALELEIVVVALTLKGAGQLLKEEAAIVLELGLDVGQPLIRLSED